MYIDDIKLFAKHEMCSIEKCAMLIMKSRKRHMTEGMELPNEEKKLELLERRKLPITWEYWKLTPSVKGRWTKNRKK